MKVAKFGGSSLCSSSQIEKCANIIKNDTDIKAVVVSAPGKRFEEDTKVTDLLIALYVNRTADLNTDNALQAILDRYENIITGLKLDRNLLDTFKSKINHYLETLSDRSRLLDALKSCGEDFNAQVMSAYLNQIGIKSTYLSPKDAGIFVTDEPSNASLLESSYTRLAELRGREEVIIIPGFFGESESGHIVTFSRGGSDITGAIVARGLLADIYENYTDQSYIFSGHPGKINNPVPIKEITYREMRELSYAGFGIFHDEALQPLYQEEIPVMIRNTNAPEIEGTKIVPKRMVTADKPVIGISCDEGFTSISVRHYLMNREIGYTRRLLRVFEKYGVNIEHIPSGIDNLSVIVRSNQFEGNNKKNLILKEIEERMSPEWIGVEDDLALLVIVGEGMERHIGVANKTTKALADHNINIKMMNQGSSEISMVFAVKMEDDDLALSSVYNEYFKDVVE